MAKANRFRLGPAVLVTAAFIGPGTVLTASQAGDQFGYALLWAIAFSVVTAVVLQEMAARLGIISGAGLAEAIQSGFTNPAARWSIVALVLGAILFGNSAYQSGNLLGAATGLEILSPINRFWWSTVIALVAAAVIMIGRFEVLQWLLTGLVGVMGVIFVFSAIACGPELSAIISGLKPSIPPGSQWIILALIGTTVVPYNLFLHASGAAERFRDSDDKHRAVWHSLIDTVIAIAVGGIITSSLLITAAVTFADAEIGKVESIAEQLRPTLGAWAEFTFAIGLFAAGLTSSITAPIAAAYAAAGCFGWRSDLANIRLKLVAGVVLLVGFILAMVFGGTPKQTIIVAQVANGMLLPIVAGFLLYTVNRKKLMGENANGWLANGLGGIVVLVTTLIAATQFRSAWRNLIEIWSN